MTALLPDLNVPDEPWRKYALCAQTDPEAFFPERGGSTTQAKAVCHQCDVRQECLTYALANQERFGIWGGLSERERRKLDNKPPPPPALMCIWCGKTPVSGRRRLCSDECKTANAKAYQATYRRSGKRTAS